MCGVLPGEGEEIGIHEKWPSNDDPGTTFFLLPAESCVCLSGVHLTFLPV